MRTKLISNTHMIPKCKTNVQVVACDSFVVSPRDSCQVVCEMYRPGGLWVEDDQTRIQIVLCFFCVMLNLENSTLERVGVSVTNRASTCTKLRFRRNFTVLKRRLNWYHLETEVSVVYMEWVKMLKEIVYFLSLIDLLNSPMRHLL